MEINNLRLNVLLWLASSDPDTTVHNSSLTYATTGDFFLNLTTNTLFYCTTGGTTAQVWQAQPNYSQILAMIAAIPQANWTQANTGASDYIKNKPTLATVATTGAYSDLSGKPVLATVATSGSYNDLINKPTIPAAQVNTDWNSVSGLSQLLNKPTLATVATSGSYTDLTNKPTIPAAQVNSDWNAVTGVAQILNKPSIPSGQIQSDWTQTNSGSVDFIKNKPTAVSQASATRTLNTIYQVSATRNSLAFYSVDISCVFSLAGGQAGTVYFEISPSSTFASGVQVVRSFTNTNTGTLVVGVTLNQTQTACVGGMIPAGYYARLRTENNTSTPTFTYKVGQEVLL